MVILTAVMLALMVGCFVFLAVFAKRLKRMSVKEIQAMALQHHGAALNDPAGNKKQLEQLVLYAKLYLVLVALLAASLAFFSGAVLAQPSEDGSLVPILPILLSVYTVYGFVSRMLRRQEKPELYGDLSREEYSTVYAVLDRAVARLGIEPPACVVSDSQFNASIFMLDRTDYAVNIGVRLLGVISEEELEVLLLHELAHLANRDVERSAKASSLLGFLSYDGDDVFEVLTSLFFQVAGVYISYRYALLESTASSVKEQLADGTVRESGRLEVYASLLAKLAYSELFVQESDHYLPRPVYAAEEPMTDYNRTFIAAFIKATEERREFWSTVIERELPALVDSHPTFRERWEALGRCSYTVVMPDAAEDSSFRRECNAALERADASVAEQIKEHYAEAREENYLKPLKTVTEWEAGGRELCSIDRMAPILQAYMSLMRYDEMEALCDRLLSREDIPPVGLAYPRYLKGRQLMDRYDPAGLAMVEQAVQDNHNFAEEGLNQAILFCRRMGMQEELEHYRSILLDEGQKDIDLHSHLNSLSKGDRLSVEELPENRQEEILTYIQSISQDAVQAVYLVRKTVTPEFFASCFIIRFLPDTKDEVIGEVMDAIFEHLDKAPYEWQYALFLYVPPYESFLRKLPAAKIFEKPKA